MRNTKTLSFFCLVAAATASFAGSSISVAQAQTDCVETQFHPSQYNLPVDIAGVEVTLSECADGEYLSAHLEIGVYASIPVSGRWDVAEPCLTSVLAEDIWPGFFDNDQVVTLCYASTDESWSATMDASAFLDGASINIEGATFAIDASDPSFAIDSLALGPFTLEGVDVGTSKVDGMMLPASLSATLPIQLPGGGQLTIGGNLSRDAVGLAFEVVDLPPDFPFEGITIPSGSAGLAFGEGGWQLEFSFSGTPSIGPLGDIPVDEGKLSVAVSEQGDWSMAGCLSSTPIDTSIDIADIEGLEVDVCAATDGNASIEWLGQASFPTLGLGPVAGSGSLSHENGEFAGSLALAGAIPAGPLGNLSLAGELAMSGSSGNANLSGCLQGSSDTAMVAGLPTSFSFALGDTCREGDAFDLSFAGTVQIANQDVSATGAIAINGSAWSTEATLENLAFGDYQLDSAKLTLDSTNAASLAADLDVGPFPLSIAGDVKSSGAFSLAVSLRSAVDLGSGIVIDDVAGSSLTYDGTTWQLLLNIAGSATIGGIPIDADGNIGASYDESTGEWTLAGCIAASAVPAGLPLTAASAEICWTDGNATLQVSGTLSLPQGDVLVTGSYLPHPTTGELQLVLEMTATDGVLVLGPGVELEHVRLGVVPSSSSFDLDAQLCLGGLCMDVSGAYAIGGTGFLDLSMTVDNWQPFPTLALAPFSGSLTGRIELADDGAVTVSYQVASAQNLALVPGLTLTSVFAGGRVDSTGSWNLELGGSSAIEFGELSFNVTLRGSLDNTGTWRLTGSSDITIEPLEPVLGGGAFVISNPIFEVSASPSSVAVELRGDLSVALIPGAPPLEATVRGGVVAGSEAGVWFVGSLDGLEMPGLAEDQPWQLPALYFAATSAQLPDFDLLDTPDDDSDDVTLEPGVTLTTIAELPVELVENQPSMRLAIHLGQTGLKLSGTLNINYDVIVPEYRVPTISTVTFNSLTLDASITTSGKLAIGFEGTTSFLPSNQDEDLVANARIEVGYLAPRVVVTGQMSIAGRWVEPFGIPRIAIQDPAFTLGFAVTTSWPPVPTLQAIGFNGDAFWLKSGNWPEGFSDTEVPAPANVVHAGASFYFELAPTPSGICLGICLPLPPVIARVELHNLALSELVGAANDLKNGMRDMVLAAAPDDVADQVGELIPDSAFGDINIEPFDININDFKIYLSTHNIEPWPGIRFQAGVHADLDMEVMDHHTKLHGQLSTDGLLLEGRVDPITVGDFNLTGSPFSQIADLGDSSFGYLRVPSTSSLTFSTGTVEGWVKGRTGSGNLMQRSSGVDRIEVGLTQPAQVCSDDGDCSMRSKARLYLRSSSETQQLLSEPIIVPETWHHLAAVITDDEIRLVVDGSVVASETRTATPTLSGTTYLGYRLRAVDNVRIWNVARAADEIAASASLLPIGLSTSANLLANYRFDLDNGSTAWNSAGNMGHAIYTNASPVFDERDQKLLFQLKLLFSQLGDSGLRIRAGTSFDPRGGNNPIGFETQLTAEIGTVQGSLYAPEVELLKMPGFGTLTATGDGPNLQAGDYDDGLYAAFDALAGAFEASGTLTYTNNAGSTQTIGAAEISLACPQGETCTGISDHVLDASGAINLSTSLGSLGSFGLAGSASYNSEQQEFSVSGNLSVFGLSLYSGQIVFDKNRMTLRASVNPGAGVGLNLGTMGLDMTYHYASMRLCGGGNGVLRLPGTWTFFTASTSVCFGNSPYLSLNGSISNLALAGIGVKNVNVGYSSNAGLTLSGKVTAGQAFNGTLSGTYVSPTNFSMSGTGTVNLAGRTMANASVTLTPTGLKATGTINLGIGTTQATVSISNSGAFSISGTTAVSLAGFSTTVNYTLNNSGLQVSGYVSVLGNNWWLNGAVHSDGAFDFSGSKTLTIEGFQMASASISLAKYTKAHPWSYGKPPSGLYVGGTLALPYGNSVPLGFFVQTNGNFSATKWVGINLKGWSLSSSRVTFNQNGLTVIGNVAIPGGSLSVNTRLYPNDYFYISASPTLNMSGFDLTNTSVTFRSSNGMRLSGKARLGSGRYTVSGYMSSLNSWSLCTSSSSVKPSTSSWLPSLTGRFCLAKYGSGARLSGTGSAKYKGKSFDTTFRMKTNGGIDYLYINETPNTFYLQGVSASGKVKIRVDNNSLTYFRWYGSLKIPNGFGGWLVNFNSSINITAYKVCLSHFGVSWPSQCANLYF